MVVNER